MERRKNDIKKGTGIKELLEIQKKQRLLKDLIANRKVLLQIQRNKFLSGRLKKVKTC